MRWPILLQILLPMLAVVLVASLLAGAGSAYLGGLQAEAERAASLDRLVRTLAEGNFPLTRRVLEQMAGLSGADFVLFDDEYDLAETTLPLDDALRKQLRQVAETAQPTHADHPREIALEGRVFAVDRVRVSGRSSSGASGTLLVLYPQDQWSAQMRRAAYPALAAGISAALLAMVMAALVARRLVRPIHLLAAQTATIAEAASQAGPDSMSAPAEPGASGTPDTAASFSAFRRNDELRDLALSIHSMARRIAAYESEVRQSERLQTLDRLGAALGHQLRNAATGATMALEFHLRDCPRGPGDESLQVALRQLRWMESYLERFLASGRQGLALSESVRLNAVVGDVLALAAPGARHAAVALSLLEPPAPLALRGDAEALRQLATNLLTNAIEAAQERPGGSGRVEIALAVDGRRGRLEVCDNGPGPAAATAERLFEPFVSSKRDGVGLGLWLARRIAESHGGTLQWRRDKGVTVFTFDFPLPEEPAHDAPADRG